MPMLHRVPNGEAQAELCPACGSGDIKRGERTATQVAGVAVMLMRCDSCGNRPIRLMSWSTTKTAKLLFEAIDGWYPDDSGRKTR